MSMTDFSLSDSLTEVKRYTDFNQQEGRNIAQAIGHWLPTMTAVVPLVLQGRISFNEGAIVGTG
jgi:hypothetical protein